MMLAPNYATQAVWTPTVRTTRPIIDTDTECYPDWWLFKAWLPDGCFYSLELYEGHPLPIDALQWFADNFTFFTFNGANYDEPMISLAMSGATNAQLKQANDLIIKGGLKRWDFYKYFNINRVRNLDHVDVMEVAPGVRVGLKTYMGRMHSEQLQDLPYNPDEPTTPDMRRMLDWYCGNDLAGTRQLREVCAGRLRLREVMGERYGVDLRSKSDAQCAEAIIKAQLGFDPERRFVPHGWKFKYEAPSYIRFSTSQLQEALRTILAADFTCNDVDQIRSHPDEEITDTDGKKIKTGIIMPPELKGLVIEIGGTKYKLGIGGLHSQEQKLVAHTTEQHSVRMDDVTSYYPSLIINLNITPAQLGPRFQEIYKGIYDERLGAKALAKSWNMLEVVEGMIASGKYSGHTLEMLQDIADGLKIVLNGTFGKLANKYSILFAPELLIKVTLTGQLCLLMLIESLHLAGIETISANTDGIVTRCPKGREWLRDSIIRHWSAATGLGMESEVIRSLYARDVNSYVAVTYDKAGKLEHKAKGAFAKSGVIENVHPGMDVVTDAVIEYLKHGKPLMQSIEACKDIRQFLVIRSVKGGGYQSDWVVDPATGAFGWGPGKYLGKTVRWYYAVGAAQPLRYGNGNKVAGSDGAMPCMRLPEAFPPDVDYARYHQEAIKTLETLGLSYVN